MSRSFPPIMMGMIAPTEALHFPKEVFRADLTQTFRENSCMENLRSAGVMVLQCSSDAAASFSSRVS